jgi:hypothetical protein
MGLPGTSAERATFARAMFLFFSNKLGCAGSLLLSAAITLVVLVMLGWVRSPG